MRRIDVWSDVACPWCYVGKRNLESALAETGLEARSGGATDTTDTTETPVTPGTADGTDAASEDDADTADGERVREPVTQTLSPSSSR